MNAGRKNSSSGDRNDDTPLLKLQDIPYSEVEVVPKNIDHSKTDVIITPAAHDSK